jgi:hypothetical protein
VTSFKHCSSDEEEYEAASSGQDDTHVSLDLLT